MREIESMTNEDIYKIAMEQSALDINCKAEDFLCEHPIIVKSGISEGARKYYKEPIACNLVSYGNNIVASVRDENREIIEEYIKKFEFYHCFETPNLHWLNERLEKKGQKICFMAEYYLPDVTKLHALSCCYELKILHKSDFEQLYKPEWSNALCEDRKELDMLPEYRRRGIAATLTSSLAVEILERGKVPFYCSAWSNIRSVRNAIKSGFIPAWVEMTAKPEDIVDEMNR